MKINTICRLLCLLSFYLLMGVSSALSYTLSGTIYAGSTALNGASVILIDASTGSSTGAVTTGSDGRYSFTVNPGTYDLAVTPPSSLNLAANYMKGIAINSDDVNQSIAFMLTNTNWSGVIRGLGGVGLPGVYLGITEASTETFVASVTADTDGVFSIPLPSGRYKATISSFKQPFFYYLTYVSVPSEGLSQDVEVDLVQLSGKVANENGLGISGVLIKINGSASALKNQNSSDPLSLGYILGGEVTSDASGNYSTWVFRQSSSSNAGYDILLTPKSDSVYGVVSMQNLLVTESINVKDFIIKKNNSYWNGVVRRLDGDALSRVSLNISEELTGTVVASVNADADGVFNAPLSSGRYKVLIHGFAGQASFTYSCNITVPNEGLSQDVQIDLVQLAGKITDINDVGIAEVKISINGSAYTYSGLDYPQLTSVGYISSIITTDVNGSYSTWVFRQSSAASAGYSIALTPKSDLIYDGITALSLVITKSNKSQNFILNIKNTVNWIGIVKGLQGAALPGVSLSISEALTGKQVASVRSDAGGAFSIPLAIGRFRVNVIGLANVVGQHVFSYFTYINVSSEGLSQDVQMDLVQLAGKVTDTNGVGISEVSIVIKGSSFGLKNPNSPDLISQGDIIGGGVKSDAKGNYLTWVFRQSIASNSGYSITIIPNVNSNFTAQTVTNFVADKDKNLNFILPFTDVVPSIITSGPLFRSVTSTSAVVEWQTDEPTTGSVKVGNNIAVVTDLATTHSIHVSGLLPSTIYNVEVNAVDKAGNGPTLKIGSFTSASAADTKAPIILEGPTVFNSNNNSLVVQWITNEPSKGNLTYGTVSSGTGSTITESALSVAHRVELTGLAANTQYYVRASATDAAGNGPTLSRIGIGRTLGSADSVAPVITNGPLIYDIQSDRASVKWKTDKPTNSGVSWNDGTAYGVLTDPLFVIDHSQQATGLLPNTKYFITVSSTDALGNGPTLSKTVEFTTLPAVQTSGPQVLAQPQIVSVTNTSAVVTWPTDQPSTSEVSYGLAANALSQAENRATLTTSHRVPLVGLSPDTTYVVQVNSKNASGKSSVNVYPNSQTTSLGFKTTAVEDTQLPVFATPPAVGYFTDKQAVVQWKTDKLADSVVTITSLNLDEPPRIKSDGALNDQHEISLTGLAPSNKYSVSVTSTDLSGNTTTTVLPEFTTPPQPDAKNPQITQAPSVQTTASTATISWTTDKLSDSQVSYGTTSLSQMAGDIAFTKQHKVVLGNLNVATNYQVKVVSTDPSGNSTQAATTSFTTNNADGSSNTNSTSTTITGQTTTTVFGATSTTNSNSGGGATTGLNLNVSLAQGWNLIGNGAEQSINVSSLFADTTKFTTVWKWVASATKWAFYTPSLSSSQLATYATSKGYDMLSTVNAGEGFWVNAAQATSVNLQSSLTATLAPVNSSSFQPGASKALAPGWSLISIGDNKTPTEFNAVQSLLPLTTLWAWDAQATNWMFFAPSLVNNGTLSSYITSKSYLPFGVKTLTPAMGFWVNKP